jgi:hypothetical protein
MKAMTVKSPKSLPFLQSQKNRILFKVINIYLIIGVGSLLITIFYLIGHLYEADKVIMRSIPGFILGISSGIIYFVGYRSMISEQQDKKHSPRI